MRERVHSQNTLGLVRLSLSLSPLGLHTQSTLRRSTMTLRCTPLPSPGSTKPLARTAAAKTTPLARAAVAAAAASSKSVWLLDYGAGNVRSVRNAIKAWGYELKEVSVDGRERERERERRRLSRRPGRRRGNAQPSFLSFISFRSSPRLTWPARNASSSRAWARTSRPWAP